MPKLYNLTNLAQLAQGHTVVTRNVTQAGIDALKKWIPDRARPEVNGLSLYSVEEFEVAERGASTFKPELPPLFPKAVAPKEETKGPAAAGQTT